jgi:hypothetical protein
LAGSAGIEIEFIAKAHIRQEEVVARVLKARGERPGLVHVLSAMEACTSYRPWHDKASGKTSLKPDSGKCLHYYFYFIDAVLGLLYLRVPTWCPFRLQFYCNGHGWLARKLRRAGIGFTLADNAFVKVSDLESAQQLADRLSPNELHRRLDHYAKLCCPVLEEFTQRYHWSLMQVEHATDLLFRSEAMLGPLYEQLSRQAVLAVKAEQVATFFWARRSLPSLPKRLATDSPPASRVPASNTASARRGSRCTTSSAACCDWRPPPTTYPFSSITARWNTKTATSPGK